MSYARGNAFMALGRGVRGIGQGVRQRELEDEQREIAQQQREQADEDRELGLHLDFVRMGGRYGEDAPMDSVEIGGAPRPDFDAPTLFDDPEERTPIGADDFMPEPDLGGRTDPLTLETQREGAIDIPGRGWIMDPEVQQRQAMQREREELLGRFEGIGEQLGDPGFDPYSPEGVDLRLRGVVDGVDLDRFLPPEEEVDPWFDRMDYMRQHGVDSSGRPTAPQGGTGRRFDPTDPGSTDHARVVDSVWNMIGEENERGDLVLPPGMNDADVHEAASSWREADMRWQADPQGHPRPRMDDFVLSNDEVVGMSLSLDMDGLDNPAERRAALQRDLGDPSMVNQFMRREDALRQQRPELFGRSPMDEPEEPRGGIGGAIRRRFDNLMGGGG